MAVFFVTCDSETTFTVDPKKVAALRSATSKLPALASVQGLQKSGSDARMAILPRVGEVSRLPPKRASIGGKTPIIEPSGPLPGARRRSSGKLALSQSAGLIPRVTDVTPPDSSLLL
jgi:hypothetical protein